MAELGSADLLRALDFVTELAAVASLRELRTAVPRALAVLTDTDGGARSEAALLELVAPALAATWLRLRADRPDAAAFAATGAPRLPAAVPPGVAATVLAAVAGPLTPRERQVLRLVAAGHTDSSVARQLGISRRTVGKHLEHTYRKLGATGRVDALCRWRRGVTASLR